MPQTRATLTVNGRVAHLLRCNFQEESFRQARPLPHTQPLSPVSGPNSRHAGWRDGGGAYGYEQQEVGAPALMLCWALSLSAGESATCRNTFSPLTRAPPVPAPSCLTTTAAFAQAPARNSSSTTHSLAGWNTIQRKSGVRS